MKYSSGFLVYFITMSWVEIVGIAASAIVLFSMSFKTTTFKGTICMRIINLVGSVVFTLYGILLPAYATAIMNAILFFINIFYLVKETLDYKKRKSNNNIETKEGE